MKPHIEFANMFQRHRTETEKRQKDQLLMKQRNVATVLISLLLCSCSKGLRQGCDGPPLDHVTIVAIAEAYLDGEKISREFRKQAEVRIRDEGCRYEYELSESLDTFGIGYVVEIDRAGHVVDFYSTE
ncbi:hypothetical protein C7S18_18900 [Ahniella affigens]|uniref:Uncharacterized protein n=2 Tax=Ahniella affigens TaxID=2021234 RepID=A0A2P1PW96_9GAMM|nr:hypothetical protein C7S18_18900 [Ahniella affigens]